ARASVNLNRATDAVEGSFALAATTDDDGRLTTPYVPPGSYRLILWREHLAKAIDVASAAPSGAGADVFPTFALVLPEADREADPEAKPEAKSESRASLSGTVVGAAGAPVRFATIFLEDKRGPLEDARGLTDDARGWARVADVDA